MDYEYAMNTLKIMCILLVVIVSVRYMTAGNDLLFAKICATTMTVLLVMTVIVKLYDWWSDGRRY